MNKTLVLSASIFSILGLSSCEGRWRTHGSWFGPGMTGSEWWGLGWLFMIVFWGLVIIALVLLIRWLASQGRKQDEQPGARDPALEILRQRYAKGEINKEEFDRMKRDLES